MRGRNRRAPRGARGLKLHNEPLYRVHSRAPRGARGLKLFVDDDIAMPTGRAPRGARGLKSLGRSVSGHLRLFRSRPARGAWIETGPTKPPGRVRASRPARGAWIETRSGT